VSGFGVSGLLNSLTGSVSSTVISDWETDSMISGTSDGEIFSKSEVSDESGVSVSSTVSALTGAAYLTLNIRLIPRKYFLALKRMLRRKK
jgi:hypothetical protein